MEAVGLGLGYGVVLFAVAAGLRMNVVPGLDASPEIAAMFLFFHPVSGGVLGVGIL